MDGRRAPQGLDAEDRVALGLTAPHLVYLVVFSMAGWGILSSRLPLFIRVPPGLLLLAVGAAMAWGSVAGRPLDRWIFLYAAYRLRPRSSPPVTVASPVVLAVASTGDDTGDDVAVVPSARIVPLRRYPGRRARRVAFFSMRGGTGRSTLAAEVAGGLASGCWGAASLRVALLDLDVRASTTCIRLGLDGPTAADLTGRDVDDASVERVLLRHESGARVLLPPPTGAATEGLPEMVARVNTHLDETGFDVVVMDLGTGVDALNSFLLETVDDIYYVFTPTAAGVYDLYRGVSVLRSLGHRNKLWLVANNVPARCDLAEVLGDLRVPLAASIPGARPLAAAEETHLLATLNSKSVRQSLRPLADLVCPDLGKQVDGYWAERVPARISLTS
ncbi:MAG: hypothetical protein ABR598_01700 [Candidatus Dormibacteria bacterium]